MKIQSGEIVQAGKWGETGGMAIIMAENIDEAKKILQDDPLIKSGAVSFIIDRFYPDVKSN